MVLTRIAMKLYETVWGWLMDDGSIITGIISGGVSAGGTVAALRVHIGYLKEKLTNVELRLQKAESAVQRAHGRIDLINHNESRNNEKDD